MASNMSLNMSDVAQLGDLVTHREEPARFGLRLLGDVPAAAPGGEHLIAGAEEMVHPDGAIGAGHLVAQVHPAPEGPTHLELADGARLEPDEGYGVVLVVDGVDEGVGPAHHLDGPVVLPDEVADDLDAVATEVDDCAAPGRAGRPRTRRCAGRDGSPGSAPR